MKLKCLILSGLVICGLLTGCLSEPDFEPVADGGVQINLDGSIAHVATRVNAQGFETGDALGLYAVNYENNNQTPGTLLDEGNQADHVKYVFDESNWKWTPVTPVYYKDVNTNVDLYAFYPHAEPASVEVYNFEVKKDQSTAEKDGVLAGYEASDFLWGKAFNIAPTESKVKVTLNHMMAGVHVVLKEGDGFDVAGDWDLLDKKVLLTNTTRKASIDLSTGEVTPIGGAQATGIVMCLQSDGSFRAVAVPQTVEALAPLFNITVGGVSYVFKKSEAYIYSPGKLHTFTITVNRKYPSGEYEFALTDTQISEWKEDINTHEGVARQYYCVHCEEPGTLGKLIRADGKNPKKIKNLKVSGKLDACDFYFMRDSMSVLQALNLHDACCVKTTEASAYNHGYAIDETYKDSYKELEYNEYGYWIGTDSFGNTTYLYDSDNRIPESALSGYSRQSYLMHFTFPHGITEIAGSAFRNTPLVGALVIPDTVTEIGYAAFSDCPNLTSLSLPSNLVKLDGGVFRDCSSLSGTLVLPQTLKVIEIETFANTNFTGPLVLPDQLETLGQNAFINCKGFTGDLIIPSSLKKTGVNAFMNCSGLNGQLTMHDDFEINSGVFSSCSFTGELKIPASTIHLANAFYGCNFSSLAPLPEGLLSIENSTFSDCRRLSGIIEFPESLTTIGIGAFQCTGVEGLIFPSNIAIIKDEAFNLCYNINSIVCKSFEPPMITPTTFGGVPKNNFTLEVPANSVKRYQQDLSWGEFVRISPYYAFSISKSIIRSLNNGYSNKYILRAPSNYNWSVKDKPDWVTVTPSSGTGKTEVTITFSDMTDSEVGSFDLEITDDYGNYQGMETHAGRAGEVVFKLEEVDYTTSVTVEQYDYDYGDGDVIVLNEATKGLGVNLVFLGDCYDAKDIASGSYLADLKEAFGYYFAVEPYATYKDYFNVYAVFGVSADSGMGTVNTIRDAKFGSQYSLSGISPDFEVCYEYATKANPNINSDQTLVVLVENTTNYGGICYMWSDGSAVACCPKSADPYPYDFRGIVQHEAGGHGFGKLADEYIYVNNFISECSCCNPHDDKLIVGKSFGWYRNLELTGDVNEVGWSHLIFHPQYSNEVDIYEGGFYHSRSVYRSEPTSCMNNNIPYFSAISRQAIVERIMEYAGEEFNLEKFYANDSDAFGAATRSIVPELPIESFGNGKQHAPVFMGDKPDFLK